MRGMNREDRWPFGSWKGGDAFACRSAFSPQEMNIALAKQPDLNTCKRRDGDEQEESMERADGNQKESCDFATHASARACVSGRGTICSFDSEFCPCWASRPGRPRPHLW